MPDFAEGFLADIAQDQRGKAAGFYITIRLDKKIFAKKDRKSVV